MILNNFNTVHHNKYTWDLKDKFWNSVKKTRSEGEFLTMTAVILQNGSEATRISILENQLKELLSSTISRFYLLDSYSHSPLLFRERQRHLSDINNQTSGSFFDQRMRNESARSSWKNETNFTYYLSMVYKVGTTVLYVCLCLAYNQQPINFFSTVRFVISTLFWFLWYFCLFTFEKLLTTHQTSDIVTQWTAIESNSRPFGIIINSVF